MQIVQMISEGGLTMIPLVLCSLTIWVVFFERMYFLHQFKTQTTLLMSKAKNLVEEKKYEEAKGLSHNVHELIGTPFRVVFEDPSMELDKWEGRMSRRLKETHIEMKKYLWILGTIGSAAPFIGLLGTVIGIIKSFDAISASGKAGFGVVAAGLGEALITTAAGIIVGVISVVFYNFFQRKLIVMSTAFKHQLEDLRDSL